MTDALLSLLSTLRLLWEYVMTHVIDGQTKRFRAELEKTGSLDEMIPLHQYQSVSAHAWPKPHHSP